MHLGNGAITPQCAVIAATFAATGLGFAALAARKLGLDRERVMTAGVLGAGIFAAQAFNFPATSFCSTHLVGGILLAWIVGSGLGALTMAAVLLAQACMLGDGGFMTLGANIINMGLLPSAMVALAKGRPSLMATPARRLAFAGAAGWFSIVAASALITLEVAAFRSGSELAGLNTFASQMFSTHGLIGITEGALTIAILLALTKAAAPSTARLDLPGQISCAVASLSIICFAMPYASKMPDGYEAAEATASLPAIEGVNLTVNAWQERITAMMPSCDVITMLAAAIAIGLVVACLATALGRTAQRA